MMSATVITTDLDYAAMQRCIQRYRLQGWKCVSAVRDGITGMYRVEARRGC